jgi:benzoylformate decarboxylase
MESLNDSFLHGTGADVVIRLLQAGGVRYVFGNPGSTELPFMDALSKQDAIEYILALQEIPAVAIADGYAQATRSPAVVNLHISCGLGNGMGMLYNAYRAGSPVVVIIGQQDRRLAFAEPVLWGEVVSVARPWTKWAAEVQRVEDLPRAVYRALTAAVTPPTGPVLLALPVDLQMEETPFRVLPWHFPDTHLRPPLADLQRAAEILAKAANPCILAGSRVCESDAVQELVNLAERLGAPVFQESTISHGRSSFPSNHRLAAGMLPRWAPDIRQCLTEFDVLLAAGVDLLQEYIYHEPDNPFPETARIVHVDVNPRELGKNYPPAAAVMGHLKPLLAELTTLLEQLMSPEEQRAAASRLCSRVQAHEAQKDSLRKQAQAQHHLHPMTPLCLMDSLARVLPENIAVVEEAASICDLYLERSGLLRNTEGYFGQRGWALGWGLNCAMGVKLAWPSRPVLAILGDGAVLYGCQGLWTAARYGIPVTFVVCNNKEYRILKDCAKVMKLSGSPEGRLEGMDVVDPGIDFVGLARSFGVTAQRVTAPEELSEAVRDSLTRTTPTVIEAPVGHPEGSVEW